MRTPATRQAVLPRTKTSSTLKESSTNSELTRPTRFLVPSMMTSYSELSLMVPTFMELMCFAPRVADRRPVVRSQWT